jgi:primosomal protein N''
VSILIHGVFLFLLFVLIFWTLESLDRLHTKIDEIPGSGAGVTTILLALRLDRAAFHDEIEGLRFQLDPVHQTLDAHNRTNLDLDDRLTRLQERYDRLLSIIEKNAVTSVDSPDAPNR